MTDTPDNFMMIGLHKLAAERGDGLIPELLALYSARQGLAEPDAHEWPAKEPVRTSTEVSTVPAGNDNVVQLRPYLLARKKR